MPRNGSDKRHWMRRREAAQTVRHDLGKYVHLEARWLGEDSSAADFREALRVDLLRTRRGPTGDVDCQELWRRLRLLVAEFDTTEVDSLVVGVASRMHSLDLLSLVALRALAEDAYQLGEACRRLVNQAED